MRHAYPLLLDVTQRLIVIIGGGAVAARKAASVLEAGAERVRVVAPDFHPSIPTNVERIATTYDPHHLDGAGLVFAATNSPEVNDRVVADARGLGVLVSRADAGEDAGDFLTPARFQEGEVIVSVSAGSAALAVAIRNDLARKLDPRHVQMAHAMLTLRPLIRNSGLAPERRRQVFQDLAADEALDALENQGIAGLRHWLAARYPELKQS